MLKEAQKSNTKILRAFFSSSLQVRQTARNGSVILLVEDSDSYAAMLQEIITKGFGQPSHRVATVPAAKDFIEERGANLVRCVLIDSVFGDASGGEHLIFWIREYYPELPFVIHTAGRPEDVEQLHERFGNVSIVSKDSPLSDLTNALGFGLTEELNVAQQ